MWRGGPFGGSLSVLEEEKMAEDIADIDDIEDDNGDMEDDMEDNIEDDIADLFRMGVADLIRMDQLEKTSEDSYSRGSGCGGRPLRGLSLGT